MHVLVGLAILAWSDVSAQEWDPPETLQDYWRRLKQEPPPAANVKQFYQGVAGGVKPTPTAAPNGQAMIPANANGGVSTTGDFPFLGGMTNRNKAIITGVAAGAGISAVAGGIAIAVQQLNKHTKKDEAKRKGILKQAKAMASTTTRPTTTPTTTTTTSLAGDEIPWVVKVILGVLLACCFVTFFAAVFTQLCKGGNKKRSAAKRNSSTRPINRELSRESLDSERSQYSHRENSAYTSYSSEYSTYPASEYSQAVDSYASVSPRRGSMSVAPEYVADYAQPGTVGYGTNAPLLLDSLPPSATDPYIVNPGSWQARPSSFDPYSYAREDPYTSHPTTQGVGYDPYGQAAYSGSGHVPRTAPYHATSTHGSELYPADVYSGYL